MSSFKFSVDPWNVHNGAEMGFSAIQFHDDDAVPNMNELKEEEIKHEASKMKALQDKYNLAAEFVAPRLWMDPHTIDGGYMSASEKDRDPSHVGGLLESAHAILAGLDPAHEIGANDVKVGIA